ISRFHRQPSSLANSTVLATFFSTVVAATSTRPIHRPTIDITPTLTYLSGIVSDSSSTLSTLQQKLAFILGLVAFLRPSDLACISLYSVSFPDNCLYFLVVASKERWIIKPFLVHPHSDHHFSTPEKRVSVRSLGSSLAFRHGISVNDIVTLGNWRSSKTFHNYCRREHMALTDFTASVLSMVHILIQVADIDELASLDSDEFFDASGAAFVIMCMKVSLV
ncbi:hypothetical protein EDC96DRAFT_444821, partial [Choanephora cucurbitarum]